MLNKKKVTGWMQLAAGDRRSWSLVGVSCSVIGFHWLDMNVAGKQQQKNNCG